MTPELDEARLVRVHLQHELRQPLTKVAEELLRISLMLEPVHEVIREAHDDHVTVCVLVSPLPDPPVEDVVEVDIGKQRGGRCPLGRPPFARRPRSVLDNSCGSPTCG
jgi:hypothetical protein